MPNNVHVKNPHTKPAGIYLKHLRTTTLDAELSNENPLFNEYDIVRGYVRDHSLDTIGDLYETELSLYSGSSAETIYSEISIRIEDDPQTT